ncbi:hypothetical protein CONCODRAFT_78670 [Conidiobolus coronatus NRRL 28638]|uniref:Transcription factor tau subunit sfc3/Tfc3 C-terminal domain-containing protein n=1 Tax=Conidiobolus coronatus (strain ATCC 28846 / CBS 209.66 / NRRL 28638) TaxID=796925 RepID=A0A137P7A0_CONC2|nr:hypothetical protein CONCODRAFT_78670 [Conidiobolus coronatus NRRL 28638]|eukprot:KXN70814.1 hypothetical protein CONCODRAFT_78670 [Conidiobolus coronatus NRRL 28638]
MKYNRIYSFEKYQTITSLESSLELDKNVQTVMEKLRELDLLKSNTLKTRYEVIIQLLWSLKVCRVDVELIQAAKEEFNKRGISSSMDKKTLGAIMSTLESHNIVNKHKLSIKTLAGEPIEFNIFYLYLYSTESPEVQTWIDDQRNRMIMNIPKKPHSSEPQQSAEVDSWVDIKKSLDPAKLAFFEGAGKLIGSVPNQTPAISEFQDPGSDKYWLVSSLRTGYVHASMIRAQILHLSMLRILNEFSINDTSTASFVKSNINPERIISTEMLFNKMTLMAYMNLVVIGRPTDELFDFISNPQNLKLLLENLPPNIKKIVFSTYTKYKSRMKANMGVLLNLGLVYPVKKKDDDSGIPYQSSMNDVEEHLKEESLVPFYYMAPEVPMYDYGIENFQSKKMGICQVRTIEQVTKFWKDLERISTRHSKSIDNNITLPPEVQQLETKLEKSRLAKYYRVVQPISIIRNTHHWRICNSHSPDQRKLLESFVDRRRGLTPLNDINKCQFIATKSGLSLFHVTQYFKKIRQDHRDKRQKDSIKPSKNPRLAKVTRAADNFDRAGKSGKEPMHSRAIKLAMVNKNHTDPELEEDRPFIPDEEGFHSKVIGASDLVGQKSQYEQYKTRVKARNDYDFQILLVYTILKFRAYRDNVIHWIGTLELFPNTHREFCRRRISTLSKQPTVGLQLAQMKAQWRELYPEAIRTGALCEKLYDSDKNYQVIKPSNPNPLDPFSYLPDHIAHANYNLKEQLEYFEKHFVPNVEEGAHVKIVEDTPQKPLTTFHLPKSYTEIPELFFATTKSNVNLAIQSHHYYILPHYTLASTSPIDLPTAEQSTLEKICQTPCSKLVVAYKGHLEYSHDIVDFFEDRYDVKNSIKSRALLSFVINQTCRFNFVSLDDPTLNYIYPAHQPPKFNQINKVNPREHVLGGLIKMILFSPDNIYNQNLAHDLLQGFKDNTLTKVLNLLNQAGLITKRKTAVFEGNQAAKNNMFLNRVIPGRSLHMSDRFLLVVMGSFQPGILRQAGFYLHQLTHCHNEDKEKKFSISPLISSAGMMTLLDILASDHVQLIGQFNPPSEFRAESTRARKQKSDSVEFEVKLHFKQSYDSLSSTFVLDKASNSGSKRSIEDGENGTKKSKTSAEESNKNNNEENNQKDLSTGESPNKEFYWLQTYSEAEQAIMLKLIKLINSSKSTGFPEMHLARVFPDLTWADFQRYLDILKCNEAAKQVGLDVKRWIGPLQDHNWKVNLNSNNLLSYSEFSQEAALGIDYDLPSPTTPSSNFSKYVSPRIWLDLNGDRNNEMYITMLDLVLRTIIRKPGITKSNLVRKLEGALTPIEIGELVDYLEQNSAIYSKSYTQPPKPGPFSRTKVFSPITKSVGNLKISEMERLITCYWPKPQCYAKFCQMV